MGNGRVTYRIEADKVKAVDAFLAIIDKQKEVEQGFKKTTKESKGTEVSLKGILTSFVGITAAASIVSKTIAAINAGMERFDALAKKGAEDFSTRESIRKKFATIAGGDQKRFDELNDLASEIAQREGISFAAAGESVFSGTSGGFSPDDIRSIAKLNRIADDPKFAFETAKAFKTQFGDEAGTASEILNKVLAASEDSPVGFEAIGSAAARSAGSFRQLGGSDEELLAGLSVIAEGNPAQLEQQTTQLDALARQLAKDKRFEGLGFIGALEKLEQIVGSGGNLQDILKESKAVKGGSLALENLGEIKTRLVKIEQAGAGAGTQNSRINLATRVIENDPEGSIQRRANQARQEEVEAGRIQGLRETSEQAILAESRAELQRRFDSGDIGRVTLDNQLGKLEALDKQNRQDLSVVGAEAATFGGGGLFNLFNTDEDAQNKLATQFQPIISEFMEAAKELRESAKEQKGSSRSEREHRERQNRQNPESHNEGT